MTSINRRNQLLNLPVTNIHLLQHTAKLLNTQHSIIIPINPSKQLHKFAYLTFTALGSNITNNSAFKLSEGLVSSKRANINL